MRLPFTRSIPRPSPPEPAGAFPIVLAMVLSLVMMGMMAAAVARDWNLSPLTWYIARASGVTLYLLLWASTMLGLGLSTHLRSTLLTRGVIFSLHAYVTTLSLVFLGLHMLALGMDQYTAFTLSDLLIPFHAGTREPWTGLGIIAGYLLAGIAISYPMRALTGHRFWRKVHWLTLPLMLIGFMHGAGAGTDTATTPMTVVYGTTGALFIFLILYRILLGRRNPQPLTTSSPEPLDRMTVRSPRLERPSTAHPALSRRAARLRGLS
jgi:predicted ferric reductase